MYVNDQGRLSEPLLSSRESLKQDKSERKLARSSLFVIKDKHEKTCCQKLSDYWVNDGVKLIFIVLYVLGNMGVFIQRFLCKWQII